MTLNDFIRKIAALGTPGVVFLAAMSSTGLAGGAAIASALALLGGPAGMYGGIVLLPVIAVATDYLTKYGLEFLVALIYQQRIEKEGKSVQVVVEEVSDLKFLSDESKGRIIDQIYKNFSFMLVGRTGVGKSSTINSLMGEKVAEVGDSEPTTFEVSPYRLQKSGVDFTIWDTPGLCDALDNANDQQYMQQIRARVDEVDCLWFVSRLDETRLSSDEQYAILLITNTLGAEIWDRSLIVFTHACNWSVEQRFEEALRERTAVVKEYIEKISKKEQNALTSVAVDNSFDKLPNNEPWLPELFTKVIEQASNKGSIAFAASIGNETQAESKDSGPRIDLNPQQKKRVELRMRGLLAAAGVGALAGGIFGPGGAVVGGIVGAALAFWKGVRR
jgi:predicted GTPase